MQPAPKSEPAARAEVERHVEVAALRVAEADADLAVVLGSVVVAVDVRLLDAEAGEDVRREAVVRAEFIDERAAEPAVDAHVVDAVDRRRGLAEHAFDLLARRQAEASEEADVL